MEPPTDTNTTSDQWSYLHTNTTSDQWSYLHTNTTSDQWSYLHTNTTSDQWSYLHTNTTSDQWSYLHKNIIFLVIILILKLVLLRLMQKYLIPVINCLLCCMNWYSWGVIRSSHRIRTRSHRIRIVVKFYNHTLRLRHGCILMLYYPPLVLFY